MIKFIKEVEILLEEARKEEKENAKGLVDALSGLLLNLDKSSVWSDFYEAIKKGRQALSDYNKQNTNK